MLSAMPRSLRNPTAAGMRQSAAAKAARSEAKPSEVQKTDPAR